MPTGSDRMRTQLEHVGMTLMLVEKLGVSAEAVRATARSRAVEWMNKFKPDTSRQDVPVEGRCETVTATEHERALVALRRFGMRHVGGYIWCDVCYRYWASYAAERHADNCPLRTRASKEIQNDR